MKPIFSVVAIARNESKTLPRLLDSLAEFLARGGEFVVVDTGSTDGTQELARSRGCRVVDAGEQFLYTVSASEAERLNRAYIVDEEPRALSGGDRFFNYGAARQFAGQQASCEWVFMPDCDEEAALDIDAVESEIANGNSDLLTCDYIYSRDEQGNPRIQLQRERLYNRTCVSWRNFIHEHPVAPVGRTRQLPASALRMEHFPLHQGHATDLPGLMVDLGANPHNDRNMHYLGRELMFSGRYRSAIQCLTRHADLPNAWKAEQAQSMIYIGECWGRLGDEERQLDWWFRAIVKDPGRREGYLRIAEYFYRRPGNAQITACFAAAAMQVPRTEYYMNDLRHYGAAPYEMLYGSLPWVGGAEQAKGYWRKALECEPNNQKYIEDGEKFFREKRGAALCFVSSAEYLPRARLAIESAQRWNPGHQAFLVSDAKEMPSWFSGIHINPQDLGLDKSFWLVTARPAIIRYVLGHHRDQNVIFLDGDTYTYGAFSEIANAFADGASMLVTPHTFKAYPDDGRWPRMAECLNLAGNYNAGVLAFSGAAMHFLEWWEAQTKAYPQIDAAGHLFSEQGWLRYALDFDANAQILRHPGYNVAYWNVCDRNITFDGTRYLADGEPLKVMHFSGLHRDDPAQMSPYQNRHRLADGSAALEIYTNYVAQLAATEPEVAAATAA